MLAFAIIYLCLQQFEGNVVYPKIVGKSVGIGGLFVLLGITIFGNLWGVVGVLIGVPLTALIYAVFSRIINIGLYQKHIEVTYNNLYKLDENGNRIGYGGGYYDKYLEKNIFKAKKVSLAYEEQILERIESDFHDIKVDFIINTKKIIKKYCE